jgi:single-strand DNA-binding protein
MAGDTQLTIVGNLTADPELRFSPQGTSWATFTVASTPRSYDSQSGQWKDGETLFMDCSIWRQAADNVAESLTKGMRVVVTGRLISRSYENREGEHRTRLQLQVDEVGPSLKYATAKVTRTPSQGGGSWQSSGGGNVSQASQGGNSDWGSNRAPAADPWANQSQSDEPPF